MSYKRKTTDEYLLLADYGYGWDIVETEESLKDIRIRQSEYRENTDAKLKISKHRIKLQEERQ